MPWKESSVHGLKNTVCGPAEGWESMALLCREFGISGKIGYRIFERYE